MIEVPNKGALQEWVTAWWLSNPNKSDGRQAEQQIQGEQEQPGQAPVGSEETNVDADIAGSSDWRGNQGRCRLTISGQNYINGQCWRAKLKDSGMKQQARPTLRRDWEA